MEMKKLALVTIVLALTLTLTFAVGLVSENIAEGKVFGKDTYRAQQGGGSGSGGGNSANQAIGQSQ
jgi:hypothetical protein